jgi:hypothetical protein
MGKITVQKLVKGISDAVRAKAAEVPDFENGAFRLLFVPKCEDANQFLGGFGVDCEVDFGFSIKEGGSRTRPAMDEQKECACYGYAAEKIEGCAYALRNGFGRRSSDMPGGFETWGRVNDPGCVVYEIFSAEKFGITDNPSPQLYLRIYVSVSGATGTEDTDCALAVGGVIQDWCEAELGDDGFGHMEKYLSLVKPD